MDKLDAFQKLASTSTIGGLTYLWLGDISPVYFPPNDIHTQLSFMPRLQLLAIMFDSTCLGRNVVNSPPYHDSPDLSQTFRIFIPRWKLESLLAPLSSPASISIFFHELDFPVPNLLQFNPVIDVPHIKGFHAWFWGRVRLSGQLRVFLWAHTSSRPGRSACACKLGTAISTAK